MTAAIPDSDGHTSYQKTYFKKEGRRSRIEPARSRYVLRHLDAVLADLKLGPDARLLELGCGMGRFSVLLAERGFRVTAVDLSEDLIERAKQHDREGRVRFVCSDAAEIDRSVDGLFDAVVGFFFLHHLTDLGPTFTSVARKLAPRGRVVFCEPNAWNPLFYLQILLTPGMTWRGDGGVSRMRRSVIQRAWTDAGLASLAIRRYGFLPRALADTAAGSRMDRLIEECAPLRPILPFQTISGVRRA